MIVGLTNLEAESLAGREFWLYGQPGEKDEIDSQMEEIDADIFGMLGVDLRGTSALKCTIRPTVSKNTPYLFWPGAEGKVFGVDIHVTASGNASSRTIRDVLLLKVFSADVIWDGDSGQRRLDRTRYLCQPANNLQLQASKFPYGANEDLFAGAPILGFSHHLEQPERKRQKQRFVCYIMKNAGVSRGSLATDDHAPVKRWSELRNETLLQGDHRIALARDLACAVIWLHERGFQHCDLSPENVLITSAADSLSPPKLALIDFDSYYTPHARVPLLPVHKQCLFQLLEAVSVTGVGPVPHRLSRQFDSNGFHLTSGARVDHVADTSFRVHDPGRDRPANYVVEQLGQDASSVWLLGAPGHQNYRAPIDLLAVEEGCRRYDNFALGMLIHELLCWIDTDFDGVLIKQARIDALVGPNPPDISKFCGPTRFILHESILSLLERVFSGDCSCWPTPMDWATALRNGPVYRICPGPMRTLCRRTSRQKVCMSPLPHFAGRRAGSWFRKTRPALRLKWLEDLAVQVRSKLLGDYGLSDSQKYCEACGNPVRL